ncbi:MAG TPA: hypothetical protein VGR63_02665 [Casimicrobiaceae bacterium]|jgi:hypothetical protein|nr:hypothetical protein [Casimicrobiaceae bacterium]
MFPAFLLWILIVLIVVGLILWLLRQLPIDAQLANIIRVVVIVLVVIWLIYILAGAAGYGPPFRR